MRVGDLFPSRFIHGQDLDGEAMTVTIARVRMEEVYSSEERKHTNVAVLDVRELEKPVILRKTLALQIAEALGDDEVEHWPGKKIELYPVSLNVGGVRRVGIRARKPVPAGPGGPRSEQGPAPAGPDNPRSKPVKAQADPHVDAQVTVALHEVQTQASGDPAGPEPAPIQEPDAPAIHDTMTINGRAYPPVIGEKDFTTFYYFAKAIGLDTAAAKKTLEECQNNPAAAYTTLRNRYKSRTHRQGTVP